MKDLFRPAALSFFKGPDHPHSTLPLNQQKQAGEQTHLILRSSNFQSKLLKVNRVVQRLAEALVSLG